MTLTIQGNTIEGNGGAGVSITASSEGSSFKADLTGNTVNANGGDGIYVTGGTVTVTALGNDVEGNSSNGIEIIAESGATVGGTAPARAT